MRAFIAVDLPEDVKEIAKSISRNAQFPGLRYVKPEHMHLTLLFLWEMDENKLDDVVNKLRAVEFNPFILKTSGSGIFPDDKKVRIVWLGIEKCEEFLGLQHRIRNIFNHKEKFMPHFTIARASKIIIDEDMNIKKKISSIKYEEVTFKVDGFVLYKSTLTSQGPIHEKVEEFR